MESPVGKEQFLRSGWRKRERHRSLDGELLLIRAARARNVRQTKRRHGLERGRRKPCGPFFYGHRSLHRPAHVPFSPIRSELLLPSVGLPRSPACVHSGPTNGPERAVRRGFCAFRSSDWTGRTGHAFESSRASECGTYISVYQSVDKNRVRKNVHTIVWK